MDQPRRCVDERRKGAKTKRSAQSAEAQRRALETDLRDLSRRVVVVVDDLDRVEPDQVRDVVRLIKLVADFPNTTYLVAYDREAIEAALDRTTHDGRAYLEKIVQVAHDSLRFPRRP